MALRKLVIFGNREVAELARFYFEADTDLRVAAFTVDDDYVEEETLEGLPVIPFSETLTRFPPTEFQMHVALSYQGLNQLRARKYTQAAAAGYTLASYVSTRSVTWPDLTHGTNCFILENQTIQPRVNIGNNVMLWSGNHVGHGSVIADHAYVASHVCISGHCIIGARSFIGVNATIRDFTTIGADCFIAMDASIAADMPDGAVAIGRDTDIFAAEDRRARALKRLYFGGQQSVVPAKNDSV